MPDPVILPPPERPSAWDGEGQDGRSRMSVLIDTNEESTQALEKMDEKVSILLLLLVLTDD